MINDVDEAIETEMEKANRDDLLKIIARQEAIIAELRAENARLVAEKAELYGS